ncbi:hypothetical protein KHA80_16400 [Anaerobacillus sp. HL2]|nr:hypothetical protein KHA80_16400 [Anaerobacillus sp. HL2]
MEVLLLFKLYQKQQVSTAAQPLPTNNTRNATRECNCKSSSCKTNCLRKDLEECLEDKSNGLGLY